MYLNPLPSALLILWAVGLSILYMVHRAHDIKMVDAANLYKILLICSLCQFPIPVWDL